MAICSSFFLIYISFFPLHLLLYWLKPSERTRLNGGDDNGHFCISFHFFSEDIGNVSPLYMQFAIGFL